MSDYLVRQIRHAPNVDIRLRSEVVDAHGDLLLEGISIRDHARGVTERVPARFLFVLIGALPHTDWLAGALQRDPRGFVATGADVAAGSWPIARRPMRFETSMPGVFAAGDVRLGSVQRLASAVGEGAVVVQHVHEYLDESSQAPAEARPLAAAPPAPGAARVEL
jgi:thioredoxin reductase (NADPH)